MFVVSFIVVFQAGKTISGGGVYYAGSPGVARVYWWCVVVGVLRRIGYAAVLGHAGWCYRCVGVTSVRLHRVLGYAGSVPPLCDHLLTLM